MVFHMPTHELRKELEQFRIQWEEKHDRHIDLTKRYTSQLPTEEREWLFLHYPYRFAEGLPEFARAYLYSKVELAKSTGNMNELATGYVRLFDAGALDPPSRADRVR